ncbi:MAG: FkbM family methyltransferase [Ruminococcus flavefaciens]|nr:FkbM family methyltransferase [Ruminococcus flavefaciens]
MDLLKELQNLEDDNCIENIRKETLPLVMWGAGSSASEIFCYLIDNKITIADVFVDDEYYSEGMMVEGKEVISYSMLKAKYSKVNVIMGNSYYEKKEMLEQRTCICNVYCLFSMSYHIFERTPISEIEENQESFQETLELLEDDISRNNFIAFLKTRVSGNNRYIEEVFEKETTFFNNDIIELSEDETYLDVGAFDGDTIRMFLKENGNRYKHIYAVEADEENYLKLQKFVEDADIKNIELSNKGAWDKEETCHFLKNQKQESGVYKDGNMDNHTQGDILELSMMPLDEMFNYGSNVTLYKVNYYHGVEETLRGG